MNERSRMNDCRATLAKRLGVVKCHRGQIANDDFKQLSASSLLGRTLSSRFRGGRALVSNLSVEQFFKRGFRASMSAYRGAVGQKMTHNSASYHACRTSHEDHDYSDCFNTAARSGCWEFLSPRCPINGISLSRSRAKIPASFGGKSLCKIDKSTYMPPRTQ